MGRCSHIRVEWDKEKRMHVKNYQNEAWKGSCEFCVFRDSLPFKDVDLFKIISGEQISKS